MTACRNNIRPELMEALQLLKYSMQHGHPLNFTLHYTWKDRLEEVEALMDEAVNILNNHQDYWAQFLQTNNGHNGTHA